MGKIGQYGTWESPIGADQVVASGARPLWVEIVDGTIWWTESRPAQAGRSTVLRSGPDGPVDMLAAPWNARNRVHEYGGRSWVPLGGDEFVFTEWTDQRLHHATPGQPPRPLSPAPKIEHGWRYGDLAVGPDRGEIWCVRETVTGPRRTDIRRELVAVPLDGSAAEDPDAVRILVASHHFLTTARVSPDGRHAAWIGWDHPSMPWDGTELCVAEIEPGTGRFRPHRVLAGGPAEAVCQVEWVDADALQVMTDPTGWWNLYRITLDGASEPLAPVATDLGGPMWLLGTRFFVPLGQRRALVSSQGRPSVLADGEITPIPGSDDLFWQTDLAAADGLVAGVAAGPTTDCTVLALDLSGGARVVSDPGIEPPDKRYLPIPEVHTVRGADGAEIASFLYLPRNPDHRAPEGELPPLLIHVHGGPTSAVAPVYEADIAFFTSRGFAVAAVNYGGSTGYGRAYRERLREQWGVVDVEDCAAVAEALAAAGIVDRDRMAIRGGSAGGWTTAASLTRTRTYRCGTALFPILDLTGWATGETHDFESRYLDSLVGPLPETEARYTERSPSNNVDRLAGPILLLQGMEDEVCPPEQAFRFAKALEGSGIPHAHLTFEGEQHGFRLAHNVITAMHAELSFYGQVLGFTPPGVPVLPLRS